MNRRRHARGFTLLELLVALAIFAVLATLAYGGLRQLLRIDGDLAASNARFARAQSAVVLIEQDLRAATARSVRDDLGTREPALRAGLAGDLLTLTRYSSGIGADGAQSDLRRVRYRLESGALYRDVWDTLDRTPATAFVSRRLLRDVQGLRLRFFSHGDWLDTWPPSDDAVRADELPSGIEFTLQFEHGRALRRVVMCGEDERA